MVEKFVLQLEAQLLDRGVTIDLTPKAAAWLADKGYDDKMGARPLGRVIQEHIKKPLAEGVAVWQTRQGRCCSSFGQERRSALGYPRPRSAAYSGQQTSAFDCGLIAV